jgi:hypothetical protein
MDGGVQWSQVFGDKANNDPYSILAIDGGGAYTAAGQWDGELYKVDGGGLLEWQQKVSSLAIETGYSVVSQSDGSIYLVGTTDGGLDKKYGQGTYLFATLFSPEGEKGSTQVFRYALNEKYSFPRAAMSSSDKLFMTAQLGPLDIRGQNKQDLIYLGKFAPLSSGVDAPAAQLDEDGDGFVDEIINYRIYTVSGGVDLTLNGQTLSDLTSGEWDAVKAVADGSGFKVLLDGEKRLEGRFRVLSADSSGAITGATSWLTGFAMYRQGYEEVFQLDFNQDQGIGLL